MFAPTFIGTPRHRLKTSQLLLQRITERKERDLQFMSPSHSQTPLAHASEFNISKVV